MCNGGAERVISILASQYAAKGWEVEIALLLENKVGYDLNSKINIVDLTGKSRSYFVNLPFWVKSIRKYLKRSKPDRVVSFVGRINALVLMSSFGIKIPIIVSERNDPKHDGRGRFILWCCNHFYKEKASAVVFQTKYEASCFSQSLASKSYIVPNPVEIKDEPSEAEGCVIVTAGRLVKQKNHVMLIDAVKLLKEDIPDVSAEIFGDGSLKESLQIKIDDLRLSDRIKLCGNVSDLHSRIKKARVFVMTSEFEGLSNALIEAMMMGLPCISTDYPGADEIIEHGVNGMIVPRNNVQALAEALKYILSDASVRQKLSEGAVKTASSYKTEIVMKAWENVIEQTF